VNTLLARLPAVAAGCLTLFLLCPAPERVAAANVTAELRALEQRVEDAVVRGDVGFLRGVYAEDFRFTHGDGAVQDRAQWLKDVATGQFISRKVTPIEVEVHGDVAVTFARLDVVRREGTGEDRYALKYVRVYARRGGKWRMLSHRTVQMLTP
jgi:ketosteroid isomerase-like protein